MLQVSDNGDRVAAKRSAGYLPEVSHGENARRRSGQPPSVDRQVHRGDNPISCMQGRRLAVSHVARVTDQTQTIIDSRPRARHGSVVLYMPRRRADGDNDKAGPRAVRELSSPARSLCVGTQAHG